MSVPVAASVLSSDVAESLRQRSAREQGDERIKFSEAAEFIDMCRKYWRACDETGIDVAERISILKDVKRYFLRDVDNFFMLPQYVNGIVKGTWIQVILSIELQLHLLDPATLKSWNVNWAHPRLGSQDDVERLFGTMTKHRTMELFESRIGWAVLETTKLFNKERGFYKPVSTRKSRILDRDDDSMNPHAPSLHKKRLSGLKRTICDPERRGDPGRKKNRCREMYAKPESQVMMAHDKAMSV